MIRPSFSSAGTSLVESDRLTIWVITGRRDPRQVFSSQVGMGSRSHDLDADFLMSEEISASDAGLNDDKTDFNVYCSRLSAV